MLICLFSKFLPSSSPSTVTKTVTVLLSGLLTELTTATITATAATINTTIMTGRRLPVNIQSLSLFKELLHLLHTELLRFIVCLLALCGCTSLSRYFFICGILEHSVDVSAVLNIVFNTFGK